MATGSAMTPFWWAHSGLLNDFITGSQIRNVRRFTDVIPFANLTDVSPATVKSTRGDGFAMKSNELVFGWVVKPESDIAGAEITLSGIKDGKYKLRIFHTWRGEFIDNQEVTIKGGSVTFGLPYMRITGGHARYLGQDVSFILEPVIETPPPVTKPKGRVLAK
jgi:hypothetical protein